MDRETRIRACYQHCVLRYVIGKTMTNQTLRKRFALPDNKSAIVSQLIAAAISQDLIVADEGIGGSKRHARYWA